MKCALSQALLALLPDTKITARSERDWHSATFAGIRLRLTLVVPVTTQNSVIKEFCERLPEYEFDLRRRFVADIHIEQQSRLADGSTEIVIEALLIDA